MNTTVLAQTTFFHKRIWVIFFFLLFQQGWLWAAQDENKIRVGIFQNKPLSYTDDQGIAQGIYPDVLREIARTEEWNLEFVVDSWSGNLDRLVIADIDLMVSIVHSWERDLIFDFSKEPVVTAWGQVYTTQNSGILNILDLKGKTVGIMQEDINAKNFMELCQKFNVNCHFVIAEIYDDVCELILAQKVDAGIINNINGEFLKKKYPIYSTPIMFSPVSAVFATPKNKNAHLLDTIDSNITDWRNDQNSIYYSILNKWFGNTKGDLKHLYKLMAIIISMAVTISLFLFVWMRILKKQVGKRTKELRESEKKYRLLIENQTDLIVEVDLDGKFQFTSQSYCKMFGKTEAELIGNNYLPLVHPEDQESTSKAMETLYQPPYTAYIEQRAMTKNGWKWLAWMDTAVLDKNDEIVSVIGVGRDITDLKNMEEELRQAHKMESIGTLAGGIAHDFNNILGIIIGNAELALADSPDWNPVHDRIQEIKTASLRAKDVVKQLLSFSRKTKQAQQPLDILPVIKESVKLIRSTMPSSIKIRETYPENCSTILADATQIHQVIINLCTNAAHSMSEGNGVLEISVNDPAQNKNPGEEFKESAQDNYVELIVKDTGSGIDSKILGKIFDPYFTTKDFGKGTGMGLALVHGIVKNHGGHIRVDSQPGKGTCFTLLFPAVTAPALQEPTPFIKKYSSGTETLLFVDDEQPIVDMTKQILEKLGYTVEAKTSSQEALDVFKANPAHFDLVISDMTMPQMDGVALSEKIKTIRPDIPIIICTGHSSITDEKKANAVGIAAYAMKPITMSEMAKLIREILDAAATPASD